MTPENLQGRVIILETKLENLSDAYLEEKEETRRYRDQLQGDIKQLQRLVFVGIGILMALQVIIPVVMKH